MKFLLALQLTKRVLREKNIFMFHFQPGIIQVDLDSGCITFPENVSIFPLPEPYYTRLMESLTLVSRAFKCCFEAENAF